jgi:hypothetical protein
LDDVSRDISLFFASIRMNIAPEKMIIVDSMMKRDIKIPSLSELISKAGSATAASDI